MRHFSPSDLKEYLEHTDEPPLLIDVREPWEYQICALQDSTLIPMRQIPGAVEKLDRDRETVVLCHHGIRSRQVAFFLERAGFTNVINLDGGLDAWARQVDSDMKTY